MSLNKLYNKWFYCIWTIDWAVNLRFLWTGRTCVNKRKQSRGWSEVISSMKWYMQMSAWGLETAGSVGVSVSLESDQACGYWERPSGTAVHGGLRLRSRGNAKWGLEDNTVVWWREVMVQYSSLSCLRLSVRPSVSHTTEVSTSFENKLWELYTYKEVLCSSFPLRVYAFITVYNSLLQHQM